MRRTHAARIPTRRRQLAFEPLEPRELLAADTGFDWSSYWDTPTSEDWSWTFDDASNFDAGGWDDSWWVSDVAWDSSDADGTDLGVVDFYGDDGTGSDAGGYDWSADIGNADAGWTEDVVTPPAPDDAGGVMDEPVATVLDTISPPSCWPMPVVVIVAPGEESPVDPGEQFEDLAVPPAVADPDAEGGGEPPVVSLPPIVVSPDFKNATIAFVCDLVPVEDETVDAVTPDAGVPADEPVAVAAPDDTTDGSWVFDTSPVDGSPSPLTDNAGVADEDIVDVTMDEAVLPPTTVFVTPNANGPSLPVAVQPGATRSAADRFAGLGSLFFQAFGRPGGDADGSLAGGQTNGQPGSGRPRLRLPFRPIA